MNKVLLLLFFLAVPLLLVGQVKEYTLGNPYAQQSLKQGGLYDYSTAEEININVAIWGGVKFPGRYVVPASTTVFDLISFAGGPIQNATLEDLRLYRVNEDSTSSLIKFDLNELVWEEDLMKDKVDIPKLLTGDTVILPTEPRYFFRDYLTMGLGIISALASLSILILNITKD